MELSLILSAVRRYYLMVAACVLLALAGVAFLKRPGTATFTATTTMLIRPERDVDIYRSADFDRYLLNELNVIRSASVLSRAKGAIGLQNDTTLSPGLVITRQGITDTVLVSSTTNDGEKSRAFADAVVATYLDDVTNRALAGTQTQLDRLNIRIDELSRLIGDISAQRSALTGDDLTAAQREQEARLVTDQNRNESSLGNSLVKQSDLQLKLDDQIKSQVVQRAIKPEDADSRSRFGWILPGLALGLLSGILLAVIRALLSNDAIDTRHASDLLGVELLDAESSNRRSLRARFGRSRADDGSPDRGWLAGAVLAHPERLGEALRVLVISAAPKATTARLSFDLGADLRRSLGKCLLIDADCPSNSLSRWRPIPVGQGLESIGSYNVDTSPTTPWVTSAPNAASLLGYAHADRASRLGIAEIKNVLATADRARFDAVVIDGGSAVVGLTSAAWIPAIDLVVVCLTNDRIPRRALEQLRGVLAQLQRPAIAVVVGSNESLPLSARTAASNTASNTANSTANGEALSAASSNGGPLASRVPRPLNQPSAEAPSGTPAPARGAAAKR
jgi:hypothetical protein